MVRKKHVWGSSFLLGHVLALAQLEPTFPLGILTPWFGMFQDIYALLVPSGSARLLGNQVALGHQPACL